MRILVILNILYAYRGDIPFGQIYCYVAILRFGF